MKHLCASFKAAGIYSSVVLLVCGNHRRLHTGSASAGGGGS
jgi:hypothetical protein